MKHSSFLMHFGKWIDDKWWLGARLGRGDRWTAVAKGVNLSWLNLRRLFCNRRVIVQNELQSSQLHFEMSKSKTPT